MAESIGSPVYKDSYSVSELKKILGENLPIRSLLDKYQPQPSWFQRKESMSGIHGVTHITRVLVWAEILSRLLQQQGVVLDQESVRWAAATHDVRRVNDRKDPEHGQRSAQWLVQSSKLQQAIAADSLEKVAYLNTYHDVDDRQIPDIPLELAILKDADALDRCRLGKNNLDPSRLRLDLSRKLIRPAQELFDSNIEYNDKTSADVLNAAEELGLILP